MSANKPASVPFLDLPAQHALLKKELMSVVEKALEKAAFIGGPVLADFEKAFADFCGASHAVGVGSGTDALRLALLALDLGEGDRVITVPNTFIATTEAISQTGAAIDLVDIDAKTCLMDPNRVEDLLKERFDSGPAEMRPKALLPVHLYGQCAEMEEINRLAERYGLLVIEDAAQAHGAKHHDRSAGSFGHMAAFSFYPGKNLGACGEAGAITTNDPSLAEKAACLRDHGQKKKYIHQYEGYNARLDAIQAGFLLVKLKHLETWNQQRRQFANGYDQAFENVDWINPVQVLKHNLPVRHLYIIHVPQREELQQHLNERGVSSGLHYPLPLHLQPCYASWGLGRGNFPNAEASADRLLSLPIFPEMTSEQHESVIEAVLSFSG